MSHVAALHLTLSFADMSKIPSPMLASPLDLSYVKFPVYASPKLDGIRAHVYGGKLLSRSGKPIRNEFTQNLFGRAEFEGLDGELIVGPSHAPNVYNTTSSGVMSQKEAPNVTLFLFDDWTNHDMSYDYRYNCVIYRHLQYMKTCNESGIYCRMVVLKQEIIDGLAALDRYEERCIADGYEGVMVRDMSATYKFGRATVREGNLLKVKRFAHDEAEIIGFEELMHNDNEAFDNELGRTARSTAKSGLRPSGRIGAFIVRSSEYENTFKVSCGSMTLLERERLWAMRSGYLGQIVRYKHLPHGAKDVPRHALYAGLRDASDIS
jgi:DNA ligase 1